MQSAHSVHRQREASEAEAAKPKIDPESEEAIDAETLKARAWDDWKVYYRPMLKYRTDMEHTYIYIHAGNVQHYVRLANQ